VVKTLNLNQAKGLPLLVAFNGSKQLILKAITSRFLYIQSNAKFMLDIV